MDFLALDKPLLLSLMVAGGLIIIAGLILLFRGNAGGEAANLELFGLKFQSSSAGLVVFVFGAFFLASPVLVEYRSTASVATAASPAPVGGAINDGTGDSACKTEKDRLDDLQNQLDKLQQARETPSCAAEKARIAKLELQLANAGKGSVPYSATEAGCRIQHNRLDASQFAIGTPCPAVGGNTVVNTDTTRKVGITIADTSKPGTMRFDGFDPAPVKSLLISLKIQYIREQTLVFWNGAQRVVSLQITPHHLIFDGTKYTITKTPFAFRKTNEIEVKLEGGKARLYVNGTQVSDAAADAPGFDEVTFNGLIERDFVYAISGTI